MKARILSLALPIALLAACQNDADPAVAEGAETSEAAPQPDRVELRAQGMSAGAEAFTFNAGQNEVEAAVNTALGEAGNTGRNEECGAGPIDSTQYASGLTLNFQDGKFVGWFSRPGSADAPGTVETEAGVSAGDPAADAQAMAGYELIANSTLDGEFSTDGGIGGFVDDTSGIVGLFAGINCFFR